ncbi:MAG: rod-binding protein [Hyphomicrobiales bacterium]|nr:rod-binding protein [Hyphomicrobiales bacterium]
MSIQPLSDIILDVANAADPVKVAAVKQRLAEASGGDFAALLGSAKPAASPLPSGSLNWSEPARAQFFGAPTGARIVETNTSSDEAKRGLETLVAKMMVETMLPKRSDASFGKGTAGDVWRSMLADRLATELTRGKGLGILKNVSLNKGDA